MLMGVVIFAFSAKIGLKSAKNVVFYILCMPMLRVIANLKRLILSYETETDAKEARPQKIGLETYSPAKNEKKALTENSTRCLSE